MAIWLFGRGKWWPWELQAEGAGREGEGEAGEVPWALPEIPEEFCSGAVVRKHRIPPGPVLVLRTVPCGRSLRVLPHAPRENPEARFVYESRGRVGEAAERGVQTCHCWS